MAYTEFPETVGTGQSGSTEGISFYAGGNSVILVSLEPAQRDKVASAVMAWCAEANTQDGSNQPFEYFLGLAHSWLSRMLKKSASIVLASGSNPNRTRRVRLAHSRRCGLAGRPF